MSEAKSGDFIAHSPAYRCAHAGYTLQTMKRLAKSGRSSLK